MYKEGVLRLYESIQLVWAVHLDMGDEGFRVGEVEVFVSWGGRLSHSERGLEQKEGLTVSVSVLSW